MTQVSLRQFDAIRKIAKAKERNARRTDNASFQQMAKSLKNGSNLPVAGRKRRPRLVPLGTLKIQLDSLFSTAVRAIWRKKNGGRCAFADYRGCKGLNECCFHFVRKSRSLALRYDFRNAVASCIACNGYMENAEGPFWTWYAQTYGVGRMADLQKDSHQTIYASRTWLIEQGQKITKGLKEALEGRIERGEWG